MTNSLSTEAFRDVPSRRASDLPRSHDSGLQTDGNEDAETASRSSEGCDQGQKKAVLSCKRNGVLDIDNAMSRELTGLKLSRLCLASKQQGSVFLRTEIESAYEIKRRGYLNHRNFRRIAIEERPMSWWDRKKVQLRKKMMANEEYPSKQIHIPPREAAIGLFKAFRLLLHCSFHDLIVWQIITSYFNFFAFQFMFYLVWVYCFALLIYGCTLYTGDKKCLSMGGKEVLTQMEYAIELSYTTFSTVGYGMASPSPKIGCLGLRCLCAFEAAIGILYFGLAGAIFFGRVNRILSRAPVHFSGPLCIQYDACRETWNLDASTSNYPTLEFRIVHNKANMKGWEMLNVSLKCMVAIDVPSSSQSHDLSVLFAVESEHDSHIPKQTYHKVQLEGDTHPYFKRVWLCRHVLCEQSPLLTKTVRSEIRRLGGWPHRRSNHSAIRESLVNFKTMIVTMTGTSNITSSGVFAEKRYAYEDIFVGWKFAGLIYLKKCSMGEKMMVDMTLTHDIRPQGPGEEEPLQPSRFFSRPRRLSSSVNM